LWARISSGPPKRGANDARNAPTRATNENTLCTTLGRMPGVDPKSVQTLMRHSDPRMTFGAYVYSDDRQFADTERMGANYPGPKPFDAFHARCAPTAPQTRTCAYAAR
jgi:hypothetical protein